MNASIAIINWNGDQDLLDCLTSIKAQTLEPAEVILVDNGSTDGSADAAVTAHPLLKRIDLPSNPGYGAAANAAARATQSDLLAILNPDVTLDPDWLSTIAEAFADDPKLGVAGSKLLFPDGLVQHAGGILRHPLMLADHRGYRRPDEPAEREPIDVDYVTGAALAIRRETLDALGGFDEGYFLYYEETDLCWRARAAGWRIRYLPRARAVHKESAVVVRDSPDYYRRYHTGRIRFALKHLAPAAFLGELVPAERARLAAVVSLDELVGLRRAFLANADALATDSLLGARAAELRPALADALGQLAERVLATLPVSVRHGVAAPAAGSGGADARPHRSLPLGVGTLDRAWGWLSTRSRLAPVLGRQSRLNAELVAAIARLERRDEVRAGWLIELDRDLADLRRRLRPPNA